jgi:hypothetical protein
VFTVCNHCRNSTMFSTEPHTTTSINRDTKIDVAFILISAHPTSPTVNPCLIFLGLSTDFASSISSSLLIWVIRIIRQQDEEKPMICFDSVGNQSKCTTPVSWCLSAITFPQNQKTSSKRLREASSAIACYLFDRHMI